MEAKIRVKCPHCGEVVNIRSEQDACPKCRAQMEIPNEGSIYIYRQGSVYGVAGGFGLFINGDAHGYIGNKELLRFPVKYGTYTLHSAVGMSRKCRDLEVTVSPEKPEVYTKVYIKPGFWANSFVIEYLDPKLLEK